MTSPLLIRFERQAFRKISASSSPSSSSSSSPSPRHARPPAELDFTLVSNTPGITLFLPIVCICAGPRDDPILFVKATRKQFSALIGVVVHRFNLDGYLSHAGSMVGCRIVDGDAPPPYEGDVEVRLGRVGTGGLQTYVAARMRRVWRLLGWAETGAERKELARSWRRHWATTHLPTIQVAQAGWGSEFAGHISRVRRS